MNIGRRSLGTKFNICIPYSDCNVKDKCHIQPNGGEPGISCYKVISPSFKDVYQDVYKYYKKQMPLIYTQIHHLNI